MRNILKVGFAIVICLMSILSYGQNFEWLKTFGGKQNGHSVGGIAAEPGGACGFTFYMQHNNKSIPDTINIDTLKFVSPSAKLKREDYFVRLDSLGHAVSSKLIGEFWTKQKGSYGFAGIKGL